MVQNAFFIKLNLFSIKIAKLKYFYMMSSTYILFLLYLTLKKPRS
ncbi:hypothetical protein EMIT0180MI3_340065 [Priestia megaterium]